MLHGSSLRSISLTTHAVEHADLVAVLTPHHAYDVAWVGDHARLVFDARNAFGSDRREHVARL
jgi:UDP-N-acetyl-D-mannosaminuronate dehydrogenase